MTITVTGLVTRAEYLVYDKTYSYGIGFPEAMPDNIKALGISINSKEQLYALGENVTITLTTDDHVQTNNI